MGNCICIVQKCESSKCFCLATFKIQRHTVNVVVDAALTGVPMERDLEFDFSGEESNIKVPLKLKNQILHDGEDAPDVKISAKINPIPESLPPAKRTLWKELDTMRRAGKFPEISKFFEARAMHRKVEQTLRQL